MGIGEVSLAALVLLGHTSIAVALFNRLHGLGIARGLRKFWELLLALAYAAPIGVVCFWWCRTGDGIVCQLTSKPSHWGYADICMLAAVLVVPVWLWPRLRRPRCANLLQIETQLLNVEELHGPLARPGSQARFLAMVPGNQVCYLEINRKHVRLSNLPLALEGFRITHLSDFHFTGKLDQAYFDYVVDRANALESDVIVISGDLIESPHCLPWLTQTLGRLSAPQGSYFVLGNHDKRMPDSKAVRALLSSTGLTDLGGLWRQELWNGHPVYLAGNESPWFPRPTDRPPEALVVAKDLRPFRCLIAHTPDQLAWARHARFDLMLAGHNHGGQICLPGLGPLISPSLHGTRYSGGLFFEAPTLLHVSRGVSGEHPLRLNCPPELTQLILHRQAVARLSSPTATSGAAAD